MSDLNQPSVKPPISYPDVDKLDIRVGTVLESTAPDWSKKLLRFVVDFGESFGKRIIFSGIRQWYQPEELIGKQYMFIVNLEAKKMGEEESQGMMIMADAQDRPTIQPLQNPVKNGTVIR